MNIYEIGALSAIILFLIGAIIAIYVFPCIWTYKDAKERGLCAPLWTCVVLLLNLSGGYFCLGLIIYLIVRCVAPRISCPVCGAKNEKKAVYCSACGEKIDSANVKPFSKKHNKFLFGILAGFLAMILGCGLFLVSTYNSIPKAFDNVSIGKMENSWNGVWTITAKSSTENNTQKFKINEENPGELIVNGSCSEGTLTLHIIGGNKSESISLTDSDGSDITVDLSEFSSGNIELILISDGVKDLDFRADWNNEED